MSELSLSEFYLVVNNNYPDKKFFDSIQPTGNTGEQIGNRVFYRILKVDISNGIVGFDIRYGTSDGYSENVIIADTHQIADNPKTKKMIEPYNQLLVFYFLTGDQKGSLWISNSKQLKMIKQIFSQKTNIEEAKIDIKRIYISSDDFIDKLSTLDSIRFTAKPDTLHEDTDLSETIPSILGLDGVDNYEVKATLKKDKSLSHANILRLKELTKKKSDCEYEKLIISGRGKNGQQMVLNDDYFGVRMTMDTKKDENGFYNYEDVKKEFEKRQETHI